VRVACRAVYNDGITGVDHAGRVVDLADGRDPERPRDDRNV